MSRLRTFQLAAAAALLLASLFAGCAKDPVAPAHFNPRDPDLPGAVDLGKPQGLTAQAGDAAVTLRWSAPASGLAAHYRVYRAQADSLALRGNAAWGILATVDTTACVDREVVNGTEYRYKVAAVSAAGLEGESSVTVAVIPAIYAATMQGGALFTRTRDVTLLLTAPQGTTLVRAANDSTMAGASFVTFSASLPWVLSPGDGVKNVFVEFRGPRGESSGILRVAIELDTVALIRSVSATGPDPLVPGDLLAIRVDAGESGGEAVAQIAGRADSIRLFDDATHGDSLADDGVYSADYVIGGGSEVKDAALVAQFTDRAGNTAPAATAARTLTIGTTPPAVVLQAPADSTTTSLHLEWHASDAPDFASYRLYRSRTAGVDTASTRVLVTEITQQSTVTFQDSGLDEDTSYYYRLYVVDRAGLTASSNEVAGRTANHAPTAVTLQPPAGVSTGGLSLSWSESSATDFAAYLIYQSTSPGVDSTSTQAATITRRDQTVAEIRNLTENTHYYYRLYVRDRSGLETPTDEVSATTGNLPPPPVALHPVSGITEQALDLSWDASTAHDFREYRVYRDTTAAVTTGSPLVRTVNDIGTVSFTDGGLVEDTRYYYRLYVVDTGDSLAASAVVSATTLDVPPPPVTLTEPDSLSITGHTAHIAWSASNAHDFSLYRLYRAASPGVTVQSDSIFATSQETLTFYDDVNLTPSTTYYYRLFVQDQGGAVTGSNEIRVVTHSGP